MNLTRRSFLTTAGAASAATLLGTGKGWGLTPTPSTWSPTGPLASAQCPDLWADLNTMVGFGPRLTGSPAHHQYIDWLAQGMQQAGLTVQRTTQYFTRWECTGKALAMNDGPAPGPVTVADFFPYSGQTAPSGATGRLVYVNSGTPQEIAAADLNGNIAVFEIGSLIKYPFAAFDPQVVSTYDPDGTFQPTEPISFAWATPFPGLEAVRQAGAIGAVMLVDSSPGFTANQWIPDALPIQGLPAIMLDRVAGAPVRTAAMSGSVSATLTLTANQYAESTDMLVTVVPGASDDVVILNTHTDGQNAIEENGGVVLRAMARQLASVPRNKRPRTYAFVYATGHYLQGAGGLKSTQLFVETRPDLMSKAVAGFTVEHLGARQWVEQGDAYVSTGLTEPHVHVATPVAALQNLSAQASRYADFRRTKVLLPGAGGDLYGEGTALNQAGVPTIQTINSPHRLVQVDTGNVVNTEIDRTQWNRGVAFSYGVASSLSTIPKSQL
ncbi:twin-arginine translocation signal domain-containing protein [Kitasatospora sp. NPDC085879]|uniref:twin-arginine translocation signal domain-containing protein n=1 Tax=Kitasatospora sp. NPDC085879 TaxID=3154769 RepID=UPI0034336DDD